jgi:hypothetical protein
MNRKSLILLFCFFVIAAMILLAASLHDVNFQPGRSLSIQQSSDGPVLFHMPDIPGDVPIWKILLFWLAFVVNLILFFFLLPPEIRKRIIRQLISFSVGVLILVLAVRSRILQLPGLGSEPAKPAGQPALGLAASLPPPVFQPPQITPWMSYLITLGLVLGFLSLAWLFARWQAGSRSRKIFSLSTVSDIAQSSLDDLSSGSDWGDVIIRSYARMSEVVSEKRGLERAEAVTPREFAERLQAAGLPAEAVNRLTRLFESVRYGARRSDQSDINEAIACLASIQRACGADS